MALHEHNKKRSTFRVKEAGNKLSPKTKDVMLLLATGAFVAGSIIIPTLPFLAKPIINAKRKKEDNEWKKFNQARLKQVLKRLHKAKLVEVVYEDNSPVVRISEKGRKKLLRYDLDTVTLKKEKWDGKWRLVIYDIFSAKRSERYLFQTALKKLQFLRVQKSVYLCPYPCFDEIEYIRQLYGLGGEVTVLTVTGLENQQAYKEYFGL
jgi:DNA-binding PadR family transcriptional regulator